MPPRSIQGIVHPVRLEKTMQNSPERQKGAECRLIGGQFAGGMARTVACAPEKARLQASGGCARAACSVYTGVSLESLRHTEE